jgi:hypothetical protein
MARRQAGERGAILGNWKTIKPAQAQVPQVQAQVKQAQADDDFEEIPF